MNAKMKLAVGVAAVLTGAVFLAARHDRGRGLPSDFRDAPGSERGAADELTTIAPGGGDSKLEMPAAEPQAAQAPENSGAADEGVQRVYSENDSWHRRLAEALGVNYPCYVETKRLLGGAQIAQKLTFDDGRRKETVVFKKAQPSIVWALGSYLWAAYMKAVSLSKREQEANDVKMFKNGVAMNERFRKAGLKTVEIVLAEPENKILVTKFLKGTDMVTIFKAALKGDSGAIQNIKQVGSALATAHRNSLAVGDLNSGNVIFAAGEPYFIDLDRATPGVHKGWDIALFFYDPILRGGVSGEPEAWALVARSFLQGYLAGGGDASVIKDALSRRYIAPIAPLYAMKGRSLTHAVRREMKKAVKEDPSQDPEEAQGMAQ